MRRLLTIIAGIAVCAVATPASAQSIYIGPGGVGVGVERPYEGRQYRSRYEGRYDYQRRSSRRDLAYYCGMGSQTPRSMRAECRRAGY